MPWACSRTHFVKNIVGGPRLSRDRSGYGAHAWHLAGHDSAGTARGTGRTLGIWRATTQQGPLGVQSARLALGGPRHLAGHDGIGIARGTGRTPEIHPKFRRIFRSPSWRALYYYY